MTQVINIRKRKPPIMNYTYIGRPSLYGNPFTHLPVSDTKAEIQVATREEAISAYASWLRGYSYNHFEQDKRQMILDSLKFLRGKSLGCFCKPLACHGDVLIQLLEQN